MSRRPLRNREYTVLSIATLAVVVFIVFVAQVFDTPTSIWLSLAVVGIAVVGGVYVSRNPRI
ncbi:hypothetical protein GCM10027020_34850 [Nocardioides salsibiostraticola]